MSALVVITCACSAVQMREATAVSVRKAMCWIVMGRTARVSKMSSIFNQQLLIIALTERAS